ncbi:MAG: hypothetical protein Q8J88_07635 [Bacteroidales bacterium]|nr:hypothetical protein [Bacteroidales bacterium]
MHINFGTLFRINSEAFISRSSLNLIHSRNERYHWFNGEAMADKMGYIWFVT